MNTLTYSLALIRQSLTAATSNRWQFLWLSASMYGQNALFFVLWLVFFHSVHDLKGWRLSEIALLIGILCVGVGFAFFLGEGSRRIAARITSGELDVFLLRPRHALPQLVSMEAGTWSLGDIAYGLTLIVLIGKPDMGGFMLALAASACVTLIFLAAVITFQSLAFFISGGSRLAEELFVATICLGTIPQHTQGFVMKLVLFSILPAGFMAILPVELVRQHSLALLAVMVGAAAVYMAIAVAIFQAGLKRYTSAT